MDTMMRFDPNKKSERFLTKEELRELCPLAFHQGPTNPGVSDKYVYANSETIIDDMAKLGWLPVQAKQRKTNSHSKGVYSFHMIVFENPNITVFRKDEGGIAVADSYPRIIMTNSHDGFNSFRFMIGMFRLVCSNGLVIATDKFNDMAIRHINYSFEELRRLVNQAVEALPHHVIMMNKMQDTVLSENEKKDLAEKMIRIRKNIPDTQQVELSDLTIQDILTPQREEDKGDDLWKVYNVLQEKMIKGGFKAGTKKVRTLKPITGVISDLSMNKKLFAVASEFIKEIV